MTAEHQAGVAVLDELGFITSGLTFVKAVAALLQQDAALEVTVEEFMLMFTRNGSANGLRPDGYKIEVTDGLRKIIIAEVEDSHPVRGNRLDIYADLWALFDDAEHWELELWIFDVREGRLREFDLAYNAIWCNTTDEVLIAGKQ